MAGGGPSSAGGIWNCRWRAKRCPIREGPTAVFCIQVSRQAGAGRGGGSGGPVAKMQVAAAASRQAGRSVAGRCRCRQKCRTLQWQAAVAACKTNPELAGPSGGR